MQTRITNLNGLTDTIANTLNKIIVSKPEDVAVKSLSGLIFLKKDYMHVTDTILLNFCQGHKVEDLLKKISDPLLLYDISYVLERVIDFLDHNLRQNTTKSYSIGTFIDLFKESDINILNYDEEVLF